MTVPNRAALADAKIDHSVLTDREKDILNVE